MNFGLNTGNPVMRAAAPGRRDFIAIAALVAAGFFFRLYCLQGYEVISNDGTAYVGVARAMRAGNFAGVSSYGFYPVFVWLAGFIIDDLVTAGRLVSITFGALLAVPVYLLGCELFSRRTAFTACTVMMFWPSLRHWSCEVMTQSSYITLALAGVYCVWQMVHRSSLRAGILAGLCMGLAYVTRTEAILVIVLSPLPLMLAYRKDFRSKMPALLGYLAVLLCLVGANLLLVRSATGSWQLASKTSVALIDAISYIQKIPDMNYIPGVAPTSYLQILTDYPSFIVQNTLKNLQKLFLDFIPWPFWLLLATGVAAGGFSPERNLVRGFLLTTCAPLGVLIVYYYLGPEYTQAYIPVVLLYCAEGLRVVEGRIAGLLSASNIPDRIKRLFTYNPMTIGVASLYAVIILVSQMPDRSANAAYTPEMDDGRRDQKNLGLVIKKNLPPGKIMTRWARIAFYSEREWMNIPNTDFNGIMAAAREGGARYLVVDGGLQRIRPGLGTELFDPFASGVFANGIFFNTEQSFFPKPGLRPYFIYINTPESMGVVVYEIV